MKNINMFSIVFYFRTYFCEMRYKLNSQNKIFHYSTNFYDIEELES